MSTPSEKRNFDHEGHFNHTHGRERRGMPVHCVICGLIAPGHEERMATAERIEKEANQ